MALQSDRYTYRITWSEEDQEFVGLCAEFPSLSWLAKSPESALKGIRKVVAVGRLDDCGLSGAVAFFTGEIQFKPYKTEEQVKRILAGTLGDIGINKMERILRVSSSEGTFFVDYYDDVFAIAEEISWTSNDAYPDPDHKKKIILDGLRGKALFLEKVKTKRDSKVISLQT